MQNVKLKVLDRFFLISILICIGIYIYIYFNSILLVMFTTREETGIDSNPFLVSIKTATGLYVIIASLIFYHLNPHRLKTVGIIFFIFSLYMIIHVIFDKNTKTILNYFSQFVSMSLWIYIYLFFFTYFSKYNYNHSLKRFIYFFTIYFFSLFLYNYITITQHGITFSMIESYFCIMMLPFILLIDKHKILLLIIFIAVILAGKRTGTIALILTYVYYQFLSHHNLSGKVKAILTIIVISLIVYFTASLFFEEQFLRLIDRFMNIKDDGGSGRDQLFADVLNLIQQSPSNEYLFGHGYNSVIQKLDFSAHNDFLEVLYDYGLLGFILYLSIYISLVIKIKKIKHNRKLRNATIISVLLFLITSLSSHLILFPTSVLCLCAFWGYADSESSKYLL